MIDEYILNFNESIEALRDFIGLIEPFLDEHQKQLQEKHDKAFLPLEIARKKYLCENEEEKNKLDNQLKEIFDGEIIVESDDIQQDETEDIEKRKTKKITYKIKGDTSDIDTAFKNFAKNKYHKELLFKNSLISLLTSVEWFFSQILHYYYNEYPNSAGIKKKTLTLEDLKSFGSIKDAENFLIDSKIEEILRSSISDWFATLKNDLNLGLGYIKEIEDELIEIYQRRNLFVHNGGVINTIYLSKVSEQFSKNIKNGDKVSLNIDYLEKSISNLQLVFNLIACELWKKQEPKNEKRSDILMSLSYYYLKRKDWDIAFSLNYFLFNDKKNPIIGLTVAQLNMWLCKKRIGDKKIVEEYANADFSDKSLVFQLCLASLKDDKTFFFKNVENAIDNNELPVEYLYDFPILEEMRNTDEFKNLVKINTNILKYNEINKANIQ